MTTFQPINNYKLDKWNGKIYNDNGNNYSCNFDWTTCDKSKTKRPKKGFVIKANESRFGEKTVLFRNCPNDIKVSKKYINGNLTIF